MALNPLDLQLDFHLEAYLRTLRLIMYNGQFWSILLEMFSFF